MVPNPTSTSKNKQPAESSDDNLRQRFKTILPNEVVGSENNDSVDKQLENEDGASARKEIFCNGWFYDVTDFIRRHPGGTVIEYYTKSGEDATAAIQQFHNRSKAKMNLMMNSLKRRPAGDSEMFQNAEQKRRHLALTEDFTNLHLELEREGFFVPSYTHVAYRILEMLAITIVGCLLLISSNVYNTVVGVLVLGLAQGRNFWLMHEGSHYSLTGKPKVDRVIEAVSAGIGLGLAGTWWRRGHNRHHAMPQRLKHDTDLNTLPFIVQNLRVVEENPKYGRTVLVRYQKYLFLTVTAFLAVLRWQFYANPKYALKHRKFFQMFCMLLRYYLFVNYTGFWTWFFSDWFVSTYIFINVSLSHTHLPVTSEPTHWVEYSFIHTADVEPTPWCDWWMGYLNYQIEHHLFPTMPQFRQPQIAHRVKALAEKHGIPYHVFSYKDAVYTMLKNFGDVADELFEMNL